MNLEANKMRKDIHMMYRESNQQISKWNSLKEKKMKMVKMVKMSQ